MGEILVLGAGVSGLTSAACLLERGHRVRLWARELPPATTSALAAAVWFPFEAEPAERVLAWARESLAVFTALAREPASGVVLRPARALYAQGRPPPAWLAQLSGARPLARAELPDREGGFERGFALDLPVIEMPRYLPWLEARVRRGGAALEQRSVRAADELAGFDAVVNCTGLGAGALFGDAEVFPIRGQIARVERAGAERVLYFERGDGSFGYVIPRAEDCVLGGTAERGSSSLAPDAATTERILAGARALAPELASARLLDVRVGLRPGRSRVRLEGETRPGTGAIVHDYGHGGAGVTLSWGCAREVVRAVEALLVRSR